MWKLDGRNTIESVLENIFGGSLLESLVLSSLDFYEVLVWFPLQNQKANTNSMNWSGNL